MIWTVYIVRASDGSLYTGITTDLERRMAQHASGRGAKFFRGRSPEAVLFAETGHDRGSALRREAAIKKLERAEKLRLIEASPLAAAPQAMPSAADSASSRRKSKSVG